MLDEADRILDLGFSQALDAIISNLPTERQTMLFSATQTKSVRDLARLSLQVGAGGWRLLAAAGGWRLARSSAHLCKRLHARLHAAAAAAAAASLVHRLGGGGQRAALTTQL